MMFSLQVSRWILLLCFATLFIVIEPTSMVYVYDPKAEVDELQELSWEKIMQKLRAWSYRIRKQIDPRFTLPHDYVHQLIVSVPKLIVERYRTNGARNMITIEHQHDISNYYIMVMEECFSFYKDSFSQKQLLNHMELMMEQNEILGISLEPPAWNHFFRIFFKLPIQYSDIFISDLLCLMTTTGSEVTPKLETFKIILEGITSRGKFGGMEDVCSVTDSVIEHMMSAAGIRPDEEIYRLQFQIHLRFGNGEGVARLLVEHREIHFEGVDIGIFHEIIGDGHLWRSCNVQILTDEIMPLYHVNPTQTTYQLLMDHDFRIREAHLQDLRLVISRSTESIGYGIPGPTDLSDREIREIHSEFKQFLDVEDVNGMLQLIMKHHQTVQFEGVTIEHINKMLFCFNIIGNYQEHDTYINDLEMLISVIMPKYELVANVKTYSILKYLTEDDPVEAEAIQNIRQPNSDHPPIAFIFRRLKEMEHIKEGPLYAAASAESDQELPPEPDPLDKKQCRRIWRRKLAEWIDALAGGTSFLRGDFKRQTQLVQALDHRIATGQEISTSAWNLLSRLLTLNSLEQKQVHFQHD